MDALLAETDNVLPLTSGLRIAHDAYGAPKSGQATRTCVLFVVQPRNVNICDERPLEYALWNSSPPIPTFRVIFGSEILARTSLSASRELLFHPSSSGSPLEVSVVYMRAGYEPAEYTFEGYAARFMVEQSRAIKCPSILGHLATFKKVQQQLTQQTAIYRFLSHEAGHPLLDTFVSIYPMDTSPLGRRAREIALDPELAVDYVLKPCREGGGNNVFGNAIPEYLQSIPESVWHTYILMELITPILQPNVLISSSRVYDGPAVSELGIFGVCLWNQTSQGARVLENRDAGWSVKCKPIDVNEMSVVKGYGHFGSLCLTELTVGQKMKPDDV